MIPHTNPPDESHPARPVPLLATYFPGYGDPVYGLVTDGDTAYWFTALAACPLSGRWVDKRRVRLGLVIPARGILR